MTYRLFKYGDRDPFAHAPDFGTALRMAENNATRLGEVIVYEDGRPGMPAAIWARDIDGGDMAELLVCGPNWRDTLWGAAA